MEGEGTVATKADQRRFRRRNELWPDAEFIAAKPNETGWWKASRALPLLLLLTRDRRITGRLDCSAVYLDLLSRDYGQGFVEILDEADHAFCAGYFGERAVRSWRERMIKLADAEFIKIKPKANRRLGYALIVDQHKVARDLHVQNKVDDTWWQNYLQRLDAAGVDLTPLIDEPELPDGLPLSSV
jgi:hypothetical protein